MLMTVGQDLEDEKREKRKEKLLVWVHIIVFVVVNGLLAAYWYNGNQGFPWFLLITVAWGMGLVAHIARVFYGKELGRERA
jgi:hypothetical protein